MLQNDYLTKEKFAYDKPLSAYKNKLDNISVEVNNVSTSGEGKYGLNCSATISLKIPQEAMDIVSSTPDYLRIATAEYGNINNGRVIWSNVSYSAKLADNKKDVIFSEFSKVGAPVSIFNLSVLAANKDQIMGAMLQNRLETAESVYASSDKELNTTWNALPVSARNAMKKEQVAWVNEKITKCGKLSDAKSATININQKLGIYECQTKMTTERSVYLTGSNN